MVKIFANNLESDPPYQRRFSFVIIPSLTTKVKLSLLCLLHYACVKCYQCAHTIHEALLTVSHQTHTEKEAFT